MARLVLPADVLEPWEQLDAFCKGPDFQPVEDCHHVSADRLMWATPAMLSMVGQE